MAVNSLKTNAQPIRAVAASTRDNADLERHAVESRAHELFVARGCQHGHDLEDWLQAEREVRMTRRHGGHGS